MSEGRKIMTGWVVEALNQLDGRATILEIAKVIWRDKESEIRSIGDLLYEWQYELRWSGDALRKEGVLRPSEDSPRGIWELM